jgi:hypothetical protein
VLVVLGDDEDGAVPLRLLEQLPEAGGLGRLERQLVPGVGRDELDLEPARLADQTTDTHYKRHPHLEDCVLRTNGEMHRPTALAEVLKKRDNLNGMRMVLAHDHAPLADLGPAPSTLTLDPASPVLSRRSGVTGCW